MSVQRFLSLSLSLGLCLFRDAGRVLEGPGSNVARSPRNSYTVHARLRTIAAIINYFCGPGRPSTRSSSSSPVAPSKKENDDWCTGSTFSLRRQSIMRNHKPLKIKRSPRVGRVKAKKNSGSSPVTAPSKKENNDWSPGSTFSCSDSDEEDPLVTPLRLQRRVVGSGEVEAKEEGDVDSWWEIDSRGLHAAGKELSSYAGLLRATADFEHKLGWRYRGLTTSQLMKQVHRSLAAQSPRCRQHNR